MANPSEQLAPRPEEDSETSELFERFKKLKPMYSSNNEAALALGQALEQLAGQHGLNVEDLLREAHTTAQSQDHHREALKLERQIAFLRR